MPDTHTAHAALTDHRHYRYRGCAADLDRPDRAQGDPDVPLDAWLPSTEDEWEEAQVRQEREAAAVAVCASCPVLDACRTYALSVDSDGHLAEPEGVWGGLTSLERHRHLIKVRSADAEYQQRKAEEKRRRAIRDASTPQKQAVLVALARATDERDVAYLADMDVRTANWHRSQLCGLLGLDAETATRWQLLRRAQDLGVLGPISLRRDGRYPIAAAPNTEGTRQRRLAPDMPAVRVVPLSDHRHTPPSEGQPRRRARRRIVTVVDCGVPQPLPGLEYPPRTWPTPPPARTAPPTGGRHLRVVRTITPLTLPLTDTAVDAAQEPAA